MALATFVQTGSRTSGTSASLAKFVQEALPARESVTLSALKNSLWILTETEVAAGLRYLVAQHSISCTIRGGECVIEPAAQELETC